MNSDLFPQTVNPDMFQFKVITLKSSFFPKCFQGHNVNANYYGKFAVMAYMKESRVGSQFFYASPLYINAHLGCTCASDHRKNTLSIFDNFHDDIQQKISHLTTEKQMPNSLPKSEIVPLVFTDLQKVNKFIGFLHEGQAKPDAKLFNGAYDLIPVQGTIIYSEMLDPRLSVDLESPVSLEIIFPNGEKPLRKKTTTRQKYYTAVCKVDNQLTFPREHHLN